MLSLEFLKMLFLLLAVLAPPAAAATPTAPIEAPARKPDGATVDEAIRLLDVDGFEESALRSTELMIGVSLAAMVEQVQKQLGDAAPADFVDQLRTTIHDHAVGTMRSHLAEMKRQTAEVYAQEFTREELARLRELHSDPVAVKARKRSEVMQPKLMMIGVQTMRNAQPELEAKMKRLVSDYLATHGQSAGPSS